MEPNKLPKTTSLSNNLVHQESAIWDGSSSGDLHRRGGSPAWGRGVIPSALVIFQGRLLGKTYPTRAIMTDVGQNKLGKASGSTLKPWLPLECNGDSNLAEYGDIKPDNLLVTAAGTVKIGDLSVSQVFKELDLEKNN
ncbi:unnamed protein product [Camellia sinensis]